MTEHAVVACLRCGHLPCASCRTWCDNMIPGTAILCCDGRCIYPGEPGAEGVERTDWPTSEPKTDDDIRLDPECMLRVTCAEPDGSAIEILALACHYATARNPDGRRAIGIEVILDPTFQPPHDPPRASYYCPASRLEHRMFPPKDVKKVAALAVAEELRDVP